jgi:hypothetical protein
MTMEFNGLNAVAGFANDLDLGHYVEQGDKALPHNVVVLYDHGPDSVCHTFIPFRLVRVRLALL